MPISDIRIFEASLGEVQPPNDLCPALLALWWDGKGDWEKAHEIAQAEEDRRGSHIHAYLHRKEGDTSNAGYWYRRAGVAPSTLSLEAEWQELVRKFLASD